MQVRVEVVGMKAFKGKIDGSEINSGTLYARVKMDQRNNKEGENFKAGETVEEWKLPNADAVFRVQHLSKSLPFTAVLEVERVSNGRESKEVVTDFRPESMVTAPAAADVIERLATRAAGNTVQAPARAAA